jgi:serine protease
MKDAMNNTDADSPNSHGSGSGKSGRRNWFWLLLILAVALVWWFWKPPADNGRAADASDSAAAQLAGATDPDDILVDLRDDLSDSQVATLAHRYGLQLTLATGLSHHEQFYRAHVDPAQRDALVAELARDPEVETAEPDAVYTLPEDAVRDERVASPVTPADSGFPNDPQYKYQWHLRQIGMPEAWKLAQGDGVIVAVIDTGVAYEDFGRFHRVPDLEGVTFVKGYDFVGNKPHGNDDHGHGTHVAGTIAQATNNGIGVAGVAPHAVIMPLKVLGAGGSGSTAGIADAIRYAADNGAKVINMSLGGRFRSKVLEKAVKYAHDKGVVVVCAAGNDGANRVSYPAAYPGAFAVAATQYDETTTFYSNRGKEIDIAAPGGNTQVDQNGDGMPDGVLQNTIEIGNPEKDGYFPFMGTSMASPHIAGVAALVVSAGVTEPDAVEKLIRESARVPAAGPNKGSADPLKYGAGIVDAPAALKAARSNAGGWQLGLGLLLASAVAAAARKRGLDVRLGPSYLGGVLLGASGLFFLPWLGSLGERASSLPVLHTLTYGFPSWDLSLLGPAGHGNALFFSALVPFGLLAVLYGVPRLRGLLAGFALGVAGHLLFHAAAGFVDVRWVPNVLMLDQVWLALNAAAAAGLAYLALRRT